MRKENIIVFLCALIILTVSGCQNGRTPPSTSFPSTQASTEPISNQQEKEAVLQEINQIVEQYNVFLEKEKSTGNYTIVRLGDGSEGVQFTNESAGKVFTEMMRIDETIAELNEKYYKLAMQESPTISYPNSNIQASDLGRLVTEYIAWAEKEPQKGTTIIIVTEGGEKRTIFIGDSYVANKEWENKITIAEEKSNQEYLYSINPEPDYQIIRRIEGNDIQVYFKEATSFPYRTDRPYTIYETDTKRYTIDSIQHLVVWISPIAEPKGAEGLSIPELEKMARDMIVLVSPEINLNALTYSFGQKIGTYFFRWEALTKPVLDDGQSYPFIQVGLNGKGELLDYINTLPMAR